MKVTVIKDEPQKNNIISSVDFSICNTCIIYASTKHTYNNNRWYKKFNLHKITPISYISI